MLNTDTLGLASSSVRLTVGRFSDSSGDKKKKTWPLHCFDGWQAGHFEKNTLWVWILLQRRENQPRPTGSSLEHFQGLDGDQTLVLGSHVRQMRNCRRLMFLVFYKNIFKKSNISIPEEDPHLKTMFKSSLACCKMPGSKNILHIKRCYSRVRVNKETHKLWCYEVMQWSIIPYCRIIKGKLKTHRGVRHHVNSKLNMWASL